MTGARLLLQNVWSRVSSAVGRVSDDIMMNSSRALSLTPYMEKANSNSLETEIVSRQRENFEMSDSPYKRPGPRRYGYEIKYKTQGCLPRNDRPVHSLPKYKPVDRWDTKQSYFGQNDYIDILGDGNIHPSDLLTGPPWLVGFKGNERERLLRKNEWQGARLRMLYPAEYNRMQKRIRYLTKLYNTKRHIRGKD